MLTDEALAGLREVGESLMTATAVQMRADSDGYQVITTLPTQLVPPGYKFGADRNILPDYLRSLPVGMFKVPVSADVRAKDRFDVEGRLFEVIAALAPKPLEVRRKFVVREIHQPERELWLALKTGSGLHDGIKKPTPLPELVRVLPIPYIKDKPVEVAENGDGGAMVAARLSQIEVSEIGRAYLTTDVLERLDYCLIVESGITPTPEDARDRKYPHFRFNGSPDYINDIWGGFFPWRISLVEDR
jgi:hypothetical protein